MNYNYYLNQDTQELTVYEGSRVLSTVSEVTQNQAEEIFKEEVFNARGIELD